jgi:hypothetical protein
MKSRSLRRPHSAPSGRRMSTAAAPCEGAQTKKGGALASVQCQGLARGSTAHAAVEKEREKDEMSIDSLPLLNPLILREEGWIGGTRGEGRNEDEGGGG